MMKYCKVGSIFVLTGWICLFIPCLSKAQDTLKNIPELSWPLVNEKTIMAHCMTGMIRYEGKPLEDSGNPLYYNETGNITESIGGLTQVKVWSDSLLKDKSLEEAVKFELKAAVQTGIDGFQFYYVLGLPQWDTIIATYFKVAEQLDIPFRFSLCISHPAGDNEEQKIQELSSRINGLLNTVGRDNPRWFRTPDGRLITYLWYGEQLAVIPAKKKEFPDAYYAANAYKKLGLAINERLACVLSINERISPEKLNEYLDYFPAVWMWTVSYTNDYAGEMVAAICRLRERTFTGSTFPDFYTSKLIKKGTWDMYHTAAEAMKAGIHKVERKYITTNLSLTFRKLWELAIQQDVPIMNIITWNDYPEGHHLAPEINRNDGFSILLRYYKQQWLKQGNIPEDDIAIAFFKKYPSQVQPKPYNIPLNSFQEEGFSRKSEDSIEVVTILQQPAVLSINKHQFRVPEGICVSRIAMEEGPVKVQLSRNGNIFKSFITPQQITFSPRRTDRLTYTWSTQTDQYYLQLAEMIR